MRGFLFNPFLNFTELELYCCLNLTKSNILMPWVSISYSHNKNELKKTKDALFKTFEVYKNALRKGPEKYVTGRIVNPVFRKYN